MGAVPTLSFHRYPIFVELFDLIYFSSKRRSGGRRRVSGTASLPVPSLSLPSALLPFPSLSYPHEHAPSNSPRKKQAFKSLPHYDPHSYFQVIGKVGSNTHQGHPEMVMVCKTVQSFYPQNVWICLGQGCRV